MLQEKLSDLTEELHMNRERADSAELERRMVEPGIQDAEERLWRAKNELAAGEVLRDELRADKEKVGYASILQYKQKQKQKNFDGGSGSGGCCTVDSNDVCEYVYLKAYIALYQNLTKAWRHGYHS